MDDLDYVLNYLRQEYSYRVWALVGHSRGTRQFLPEAHPQVQMQHFIIL